MAKKRIIKPFNVICWNLNLRKFEAYDVMPYFIECYKSVKRRKICPKTFDEFKKFVECNSMYRYWSRCEYEIILSDWPSQGTEEKIDVHWQIKMNIDLITDILMENVLGKDKNNRKELNEPMGYNKSASQN